MMYMFEYASQLQFQKCLDDVSLKLKILKNSKVWLFETSLISKHCKM